MDMDRSMLLQLFGEETAENIALLNRSLMAIEQNGRDADALREAFRVAHTIKGGARALGAEPIARIAHAIEDVLGAARDRGNVLGPAHFGAIFAGIDALQKLLEAALQGSDADIDVDAVLAQLQGQHALAPVAPAAESTAPAAPARPEVSELPTNGRATVNTVRVRSETLDRLLDVSSELLTHRYEDRQQVHVLARQLEQLGDLVRRLAEVGRDRALSELATTLIARLSEVSDSLQRLEHLENEVDTLATSIQDEAIGMRLLPVGPLLESAGRPIRDLASEQGKQVHVVVEAGNVVLDRKIIESLPDALIHLSRNAVDHGIELPQERVAAGKPPQGMVKISARNEGANVVVEMQDDGRGIQAERVLNAAVERKLITAERARQLNENETLELLFLPGLSTKPEVTATSGRGVGMDVVRHNVRRLGGRIELRSIPGQSTTMRLLLPLTLAITRVLLVRAGNQLYGLPISSVTRVFKVPTTEVKVLQGQEVLRLGAETVPLVSLAHRLGMPVEGMAGDQTRICVLLPRANGHVAYQVDSLLDERDVIVKPLGKAFESRVPFVGGALLDGRRPVLILDVGTLVSTAWERTSPSLGQTFVAAGVGSANSHRAKPRLLVVDDSVTTRELERSILQNAGYDVDVAVDGMDALDKLSRKLYDVVVVDVEMPRMNGFELTAQLRGGERTRTLPVVMVTARETEQDRRRGLEVGANAYIGKSTFEQDDLLETVRRFVT